MPEERWMELVGNEGEGISFEIKEGTYISPDYAKELTLKREESEGKTSFVLSDPNGTHTIFINNGAGAYYPEGVSFQATPTSVRYVYEKIPVSGILSLKRMIAPTPSGVTCGDETSIEEEGCRTLIFEYKEDCNWGGVTCKPQFISLASIRYYDATGKKGSPHYQTVAEYNYALAAEYLTEAWDPRLPELKEKYTYREGSFNNLLTSLSPPGVEPWEFDYYELHISKPSKLKNVSRSNLAGGKATTTIAYEVPVSGEGAPYDMSAASVAKWGQADFPVDATAVFPPTEVPSEAPERLHQGHRPLHGPRRQRGQHCQPAVAGSLGSLDLDLRSRHQGQHGPQPQRPEPTHGAGSD